MIPTEIERKYLLKSPDEKLLSFWPCTELEQGYLTFDGNEIRIRIGKSKYSPKITIKQGSGVSRLEFEFEVAEAVGFHLMDLARPYVITKRRYNVGRWEIDFFDDPDTQPLAEIELECEEESPPSCPLVDMAQEVTGDPAFLNRNIALRIGTRAQAKLGYHLRHIPRGILGTVSKIREELEEVEDATIQKNNILQLVELSDLYGAIEHCVESKGHTMKDLENMAAATRRAFTAGERA